MILIENKNALYSYEILEKFDAGIELLGHEVKALRKGMGSLRGAYVSDQRNELLIVGMDVPPYQQGNVGREYDPKRPRKLIMRKEELRRLTLQSRQKGLSLLPLSFYTKGRYIKVEVALVRGKKKYDKRATLAKRDADRHMERVMKGR